ncbi:hypothetical protein AaE_012476 [Aphanomyces astaci]|uniref:DDE Tnp4 domain-containing protein n=3 Tax=Aphanomyces astaci TaxID=112090 RepID=A0A6A4ZFX7_APHAT|nr:hypothetical protein AaE_012476 [Aphanomyces astaci]
MPVNTNAVLNRLQDQAVRDQSYLESCLHDFGEVSHLRDDCEDPPENPMMDKFLIDLGSEGIRSMTNFTVTEFESLWAMVDDAMNTAWMEGRGRRSTTSPKDALFMALTVLKHFSTWEKHAADFGYKAPTFEKLIMRVLHAVQPVLYGELIRVPSMSDLSNSDRRFDHFPYALYAVDVKFQPAQRPTGRFAEQKHYFSGKHHLYGYKIEASVSPEGRCVAMSESFPGSVHDLTILHTRTAIHATNLLKSAGEQDVPDYGELSTQYRGSWACLVDMGYIGIAHSLRGIHPKRRPVHGVLDAHDMDRNHDISSDRVVVENFFGRVCTLWKISLATYTWGEKNYNTIQRTTFALTNFHLSLMPLRAEDEGFYRSVIARYEQMANEKKRKRSEAQRRYRLNRQERLSIDSNRATRYLSPSMNRSNNRSNSNY